MKKIFKTVALLSVLSIIPISCQKDISEPINIVRHDSVYNVAYIVNGEYHSATINGKEALHNFMQELFFLAREGNVVSFKDGNSSNTYTIGAKEKVTFSTQNQEEAIKWAEYMFNQGYEVTVIFDEETGTYTCIAIR